MKKIIDYIGILRFYSLLDLVLMLLAIKASVPELVGAVFLHIGFLAYLEYKHAHIYRVKVPYITSVLFTIIGVVSYSHIESFGYIISSYLYTKKTKKLGWFSPIARGLQNLFIVGGVIGYSSTLSWLAPTLLFIRNAMGDFRDTTKDKSENMKTIPVLLGFAKSYKNIHLLSVLLTSTVWVCILGINILWLLPVYLVEIYTYNLTPR